MSYWEDRAACKGVDPKIFHPTPTAATTKRAKAICETCDVTDECLQLALSRPWKGDTGIYGGTSQKDRLRIRKTLRGAK